MQYLSAITFKDVIASYEAYNLIHYFELQAPELWPNLSKSQNTPPLSPGYIHDGSRMVSYAIRRGVPRHWDVPRTNYSLAKLHHYCRNLGRNNYVHCLSVYIFDGIPQGYQGFIASSNVVRQDHHQYGEYVFVNFVCDNVTTIGANFHTEVLGYQHFREPEDPCLRLRKLPKAYEEKF